MEDSSKKMPYRFTVVPFQLIRCHRLLNTRDRDIYIQILAFGSLNCIYSVEKWTKDILQSGEDAFYQSILKLKLLGLIEVEWGSRGVSTIYKAVADPSLWKLPKEIVDLLQADRNKMNLPPIVFKDSGYDNISHFIMVYNKWNRRYAIKPRKYFGEKPIRTPINEEDLSWLKKLENIEGIHMTGKGIVLNYYFYSVDILELKSSSEPCPLPMKKAYLTKLEKRFKSLSKHPPDEFSFRLLDLANELSNQNHSGKEIHDILKSRISRDEDFNYILK